MASSMDKVVGYFATIKRRLSSNIGLAYFSIDLLFDFPLTIFMVSLNVQTTINDKRNAMKTTRTTSSSLF